MGRVQHALRASSATIAASAARVPPSVIFSAMPRRFRQDRHEDRLGPGLDRHPAMARISSVQARPSPATSLGVGAIASRSAPSPGRGRASPSAARPGKGAIAPRQPGSEVAKFGAEQPSIP
jgi:hypothetical protein